MNSTDPASLQNLNDIVMPASISWWPLAPGWYVLLGLLLAALAWTGYRLLQRRLANRYRREAQAELLVIESHIRDPKKRDRGLRQVPQLLKRTALSTYPRDQVASLSGPQWHSFLNSTAKKPLFTGSTLSVLNRISYSSGDLNAIDAQAADDLVKACREWLKHHQAKSGNINSRDNQ